VARHARLSHRGIRSFRDEVIRAESEAREKPTSAKEADGKVEVKVSRKLEVGPRSSSMAQCSLPPTASTSPISFRLPANQRCATPGTIIACTQADAAAVFAAKQRPDPTATVHTVVVNLGDAGAKAEYKPRDALVHAYRAEGSGWPVRADPNASRRWQSRKGPTDSEHRMAHTSSLVVSRHIVRFPAARERRLP